jgi:TP53 regulating kinase and related kinases
MSSTTTTSDSIKQTRKEMWDLSPRGAWTLLSQGAEARVWKVPTVKSNANQRKIDVDDDDVDENVSFAQVSSLSLSLSSPTAVSFIICKERFVKSYRHAELDAKLTKSRCRSEARLLEKCVKLGLSSIVPALIKVDPPNIFMEYVNGPNLKTFLQQRQQKHQPKTSPSNKRQRLVEDAGTNDPPHKDDDVDNVGNHDEDQLVSCINLTSIDYDDLAQRMGILIGQLHNIDIIHGDLTTSNILLVMPVTSRAGVEALLPTNESVDEKSNSTMDPSWKLMLIDFGLGKSTTSIEEHAVDLYVLERALQSTHPELPNDFMERLLNEYAKIRQKSKAEDVLRRLEDVRKRGRKRECFG